MDIQLQISMVFKAVAEYSAKPEYIMSKRQDELVCLIAALPFLAHCSHPERISVLHTSAYFIMATKGNLKRIFSHDKLDDSTFMERLAPLNTFKDGDSCVIKRGLNLLLLIMIQDYIVDLESDKLKDKYNPIAYGVWDGEALREQLIIQIRNSFCPEMESIFPLSLAVKRSFWIK